MIIKGPVLTAFLKRKKVGKEREKSKIVIIPS